MPNTKAPAGHFDVRQIRELADILNETGLTEIEVDRDGLRIRVARAPAPVTVTGWAAGATAVSASAAPPPAAAGGPVRESVPSGDIVTSPMVGTVYFQAQPGAEPFARVGDMVVEGQTLLLVEAMKTMNPITAPRSGRIVEFLVADAQPVEYGEPLVVIG